MPEPIEIVIRKTQETSTQGTGTQQKDNKGKESTQAKAINTALIRAGKRIASYGLSQYGNFTGNTIRQRQIEDTLQVASYISEIAVGGWVGAISVGVQLGTSAFSTEMATRKSNQQAELLYQRSGNVTLNGGRGTYD